MMRYILAGILLVMTAAIGFVTFQWYQARYGGEVYGAPFTLVDQNGAEITEAAFRGHPSACSSASPIVRRSARPRCSRWTAG